MFSHYMLKKHFSIKHCVSKSALLYQHYLLFPAPSLSRSLQNHISLSYFSTTAAAHVKTPDLSGVFRGVSTETVEGNTSGETQELQRDESFTVSYLIQSLGLSRKAASRCSRIRLQDTESADLILALFRWYGLSTNQIASVVRRIPEVLKCEEQDVRHKLEFFRSVGASKELIGTLVAWDSSWLLSSFKDTIIPNYNFIKSILSTDQRAIRTIKRNTWLLRIDLERLYSSNIKRLEELKVPESSIRYLVGFYPEAVFQGDEFEESVSKVLEMGFDPLKSTFVSALHAVSGDSNKASWARSYEIYIKWGWSKEDICMAVRKNPNCMIISQKKLEGILEFLVHRMGFEPKTIAENATCFNLSLEKRIIPRFSVIQVLLLEGLISENRKIATVLGTREDLFLTRYVVRYETIVPELHDIYEGKSELVEPDASQE